MMISKLMVYAQSIQEYKLGSVARNLMIIGSNDQSQPTFKKKASTQEDPRGF